MKNKQLLTKPETAVNIKRYNEAIRELPLSGADVEKYDNILLKAPEGLLELMQTGYRSSFQTCQCCGKKQDCSWEGSYMEFYCEACVCELIGIGRRLKEVEAILEVI